MDLRRDNHEGSRNHGHDGDGVELLANAVRGLAMEFLDFKHDLLIPVLALNFPAVELQSDDLLSRKAGLVEQIGEKHRDCSIRTDEPDDSQLND